VMFSDADRADVHCLARPRSTALVATWSLSEMTLADRAEYFPRFLDIADHFLVAYAPSAFEGIDNEAYFAGVRDAADDVEWAVSGIEQTSSMYMMGTKR
jgi:hypothetical protein